MISEYYIKRTNLVIDYINANIKEDLNLELLAEISSFSKFHFHRIFKAVTSENLNEFIKRIKLEQAGRLVLNSSMTLTEIAYEYGFSNLGNFSRAFTDYFLVSPSQARKTKYLPQKRTLHKSDAMQLEFIDIEEIPDYNVIYNRILTGYDTKVIRKEFEKVYYWTVENAMFSEESIAIGIGYDDPDYTPGNKCRYDACLTIENTVKLPVNCPFNKMKINGGIYATFQFEGKSNEFYAAWDLIFKDWLIKSNYEPLNKPHMEIYLQSEKVNEGIYKAKLCLPIKNLEK